MSKTDLEEWTSALNYAIEKNNNTNWAMSIPKIEIFWKTHLIPEKKFNEKAMTGDLLLFSGKGFACEVQRILSWSRYGTPINTIIRSCSFALKKSKWPIICNGINKRRRRWDIRME